MDAQHPELFVPTFQDLSTLQTASLAAITLLWVGLLVLGFRKISKKSVRPDSGEWRWLALLVLLILPLNYLAVFQPFAGEALNAVGRSTAVLVALFGLLPGLAAVGLVGPLPAAGIAALSGVIQTVFWEANPLTALVFVSFILAFSWRQSEIAYEEASASLRSPLQDALSAYAMLCPLLVLLQIVISLIYQQRDLISILNQSLLVIFSLLPAILAAGGIVQLSLRWLGKEWQPLKFLKTRLVNSYLNVAIEQLGYLADGKYDVAVKELHSLGKETALVSAIERLRIALRQRDDTQKRLLSLDPVYYTREGNDLVLSSVLRAALVREASSARLVLLSSHGENSAPETRLRMGQGENTRLYAYLDVMILDKIGNQDQLILSDLKVDQYFGLTTGMPYPQSIVALQLRQEGVSQGILWVGFDENRWFSDEDIRFYQQLAQRASATIAAKERSSRIADENRKLRSALEALPEPILLCDSSGELTFANQAARALTGIVGPNGAATSTFPGELTGDLAEMAHSADKNPLMKTISFDGKSDYSATSYPLPSDKQEEDGRVIILRDLARFKQLNAQKNEFVTNISHDLRSPLSMIQGYVKLVSSIGTLSEEQQKYIGRIESGIDSMNRLVGKVFSLERLDSGDAMQYTTFPIRKVIEETLSQLMPQARQHKVTLSVSFDGLKQEKISADQVFLTQAIFNLIENAIKFSPRGGEVLISASSDNRQLHFSVKDHGKGIAPLDIPRIFTRFFHVEVDDQYEMGGQGLGLAIVKTVVERHGGQVEVESKLGEGSTFSFDLPLKK